MKLLRIVKEMTNETQIHLDFDTLYGKAFRLVHTPEGATDNWHEGLISVVTPENSNAWTDWIEVPKETINKFRENNVLSNLADYKRQQIIRSAKKLNLI